MGWCRLYCFPDLWMKGFGIMTNKTVKIAVIGGGNVAWHLMSAFGACPDVDAVPVNSRTFASFPKDADLYLIAVKDSVVKDVSDKLPSVDGIVAHTSGSMDISVLSKHPHRGVFYPLQTFTKGDSLNYSQIPIFLEGISSYVSKMLRQTASLITDRVYEADGQLRRRLHLAAVFACNFSNRLYDIADSFLRESGFDFSVLLPLVRQTVDKLDRLTPSEAQTGPAVRGDLSVCDSQLRMIADRPEMTEIYRLMTASIYNSRNQDECHRL